MLTKVSVSKTERDEIGSSRRVARMQFYLIHCRDHLAGRVGQELLQITDLEVRHTDISNFACV